MRFLLISAVLALVGCDNIVLPTVQGRHDPYPSKQVQFANEELAGTPAVGLPTLSARPGGACSLSPCRFVTRRMCLGFTSITASRSSMRIARS